MRIVRDLLATLLLLALMAISAVGMMIYMPSFSGRLTRINAMGRGMMEAWSSAPPTARVNNLFWLWLGLFFAVLLTFLIAYIARQKRAKIEVQMGDGRVVVLDSAIKKYIRTALGDIPDVTHKRVELRQSRQGIEASVYAQVRTHQKLPDLERQIIRRVRQALSDELGITSIAGVHVFIKDFEVRQRPSEPAQPEVVREPVTPPPVVVAPPPREAAKPVSAEPAAETPVWRPAPAETPVPPPATASYSPMSTTEHVEAPVQPEAVERTTFSQPPAAADIPDLRLEEDAPTPVARPGLFSRWRRKGEAPHLSEPEPGLASEPVAPEPSMSDEPMAAPIIDNEEPTVFGAELDAGEDREDFTTPESDDESGKPA
jgi:uncharacterized alkaline shock family protein YloU